MATVLFAGFGDLGCEAGRLLHDASLSVVALRRSAHSGLPGVPAYAVDLREPFRLPPMDELPSAVVIAVSPQSSSPDDYQSTYVGAVQHVLRALQAAGAKPRLVLFVSSTGIWPEGVSQWLTEDVPAQPDSWRGESMQRAEQVLFAGPFPASTLRLGGIYGPDRYLLVRKAEAILAGQEKMPPPAWTNRVHRDDAARMIAFLVNRALSGVVLDKVYNGVDNEPALNVDVLSFIASQLRGQASGSVDTDIDITSAAPPANTAVGGKRVGNARLRALGFQFLFPDFRAGYASVVADYRRQR